MRTDRGALGRAVVPLCCSQPATAQGRRLRRELKRMVVWWGTPLEARSAFARLLREGHLTADERVTAVKLLTQLRVAWDEILPTQKVRSLAEDLPDAHNIRAAPRNWRRRWCGAGNVRSNDRSSVSTSASGRQQSLLGFQSGHRGVTVPRVHMT